MNVDEILLVKADKLEESELEEIALLEVSDLPEVEIEDVAIDGTRKDEEDVRAEVSGPVIVDTKVVPDSVIVTTTVVVVSFTMVDA